MYILIQCRLCLLYYALCRAAKVLGCLQSNALLAFRATSGSGGAYFNVDLTQPLDSSCLQNNPFGSSYYISGYYISKPHPCCHSSVLHAGSLGASATHQLPISFPSATPQDQGFAAHKLPISYPLTCGAKRTSAPSASTPPVSTIRQHPTRQHHPPAPPSVIASSQHPQGRCVWVTSRPACTSSAVIGGLTDAWLRLVDSQMHG